MPLAERPQESRTLSSERHQLEHILAAGHGKGIQAWSLMGMIWMRELELNQLD